MEKFYVASSFRNIDAVNYVTKQLVNKGYVHTYDWTKNAQAREDKTSTFEDLIEIGQNEKNAVLESDFIVVLLPGGKGTHIELGIALGLEKKIFLYSPDGAINHFETTITFYHLPEVEKCYRTLDELIEKIIIQLPLNQEVY
ncbi:nucleoside 2-deoxyribosyltransferase [Mesobacillus jeotgali]|uniref:nucleoside 2-deoxyribosyltransferase n=1 Tax=Mesobacillus jeotgali TaxID=129985 RepID=UPI00177FEBFF|nr:nucleoside 2-deoxyribosyltransferase [Mesobacillus jeotgali]UYZ24063.1 nucleoside 2-deoxyribosyltransferase [Mesobacillus jeotgali]